MQAVELPLLGRPDLLTIAPASARVALTPSRLPEAGEQYRFHFDVVVAKSPVSALRVGFVQLDAIRDGAEKFTDIAVDGEMKTRLPVIAFRKRYQIFKVGYH